MAITLQDDRQTLADAYSRLQRGYGDTRKRNGAAPLSIPLYRWKGHSFQITYGIEMQYQGRAQILGWDPNQVMATVTFTSPTNQVLEEHRLRLRHISNSAPENGTYRAVGLLGRAQLTKDIYNRTYSVELHVETDTVISVLPGGFLVFGAWARLTVGSEAAWSRTYEPPRPPSSIPMEGWKETWLMGDVHLIEAS
jgi:hypothetical protein